MPRFSTPATPGELIVNEKIFGRCNHRNWDDFEDRSKTRTLKCTQCGEEFIYSSPVFGALEDRPLIPPSEFLLMDIQHYATDPSMVRFVLHQVEAGGWRSVIREVAGTLVCSFDRNGTIFSSKPLDSHAGAVCEAAALLGASDQFLIPKKW